jgi:hypothetical protein
VTVEKYGRARQTTDDNIIWCMCFVYWITKATETHSEYVTLIASPRQQSLRELGSVLRYTLPVLVVPTYNDSFHSHLMSVQMSG